MHQTDISYVAVQAENQGGTLSVAAMSESIATAFLALRGTSNSSTDTFPKCMPGTLTAVGWNSHHACRGCEGKSMP